MIDLARIEDGPQVGIAAQRGDASVRFLGVADQAQEPDADILARVESLESPQSMVAL